MLMILSRCILLGITLGLHIICRIICFRVAIEFIKLHDMSTCVLSLDRGEYAIPFAFVPGGLSGGQRRRAVGQIRWKGASGLWPKRRRVHAERGSVVALSVDNSTQAPTALGFYYIGSDGIAAPMFA